MEKRCPLNGTVSCEGCTFLRHGKRYSDAGQFIEEVSRCVFHQIADCLENLVTRQVGQQKEMNKVANQLLNLGKLANRSIHGPATSDPALPSG